MSEIDKHKGRIEDINYHHIINKHFDNLTNQTIDHLDKALPQLYSHGDDKAEEKLASSNELDRRTSLLRRIVKTAASVFDRNKADMENRRSQIGGKIKVLTDDIKNQIVSGVQKNLEIKKIIKEVIEKERKLKDEELAKATDDEVKSRIKKEIKSLYNKQRYKIERAVRTESVNTSARAQLLRFQSMNVQQVTLETSHDPLVCPKCRNLERSQRKFDIDKLLLLGHYPLSTLTHPQCRCSFDPVINEIAYDNNVGEIKNIPLNETKSIKRLVKEIDFKIPVTFVDDVTQLPEFTKQRTNSYLQKGEPKHRAKLFAENDKTKLSGQVAYLRYQGKVYLDKKADKKDRFVYIIARLKGMQIWRDQMKDSELTEEVKDLFKKRTFERTQLKDHKKLFFDETARGGPRAYFIEGYAHYLIHPEVLREIDPDFFDYLKWHVFKGRDYLNFSI